jgi:S-adenosylmethionine hydrolase
MSIITLLTDFGLKDCYVAAMKGMILNICSDVTIVDITHESDFFDVPSAAFILYNSYFTFPDDTVHVCVVDPGVGTERDVLVIRDSGHWFAGPDNGIFSLILQKPYPLMQEIFNTPFFKSSQFRQSGKSSKDCSETGFSLCGEPQQKDQLSDADTMIWRLKRDSFEDRVSKTFHGRDIFAPVGALLCCPEKRAGLLSEHFEFLGTDSDCVPYTDRNSMFLDAAVLLSDILKGSSSSSGRFISCRAVHIDTYGNIVTDIWADKALSSVSAGALRLGEELYDLPVTQAFQGVSIDGMLMYRGSAGLLEIAVNRGSAAQRLSIGRGDRIEIRFT